MRQVGRAVAIAYEALIERYLPSYSQYVTTEAPPTPAVPEVSAPPVYSMAGMPPSSGMLSPPIARSQSVGCPAPSWFDNDLDARIADDVDAFVDGDAAAGYGEDDEEYVPMVPRGKPSAGMRREAIPSLKLLVKPTGSGSGGGSAGPYKPFGSKKGGSSIHTKKELSGGTDPKRPSSMISTKRESPGKVIATASSSKGGGGNTPRCSIDKARVTVVKVTSGKTASGISQLGGVGGQSSSAATAIPIKALLVQDLSMPTLDELPLMMECDHEEGPVRGDDNHEDDDDGNDVDHADDNRKETKNNANEEDREDGHMDVSGDSMLETTDPITAKEDASRAEQTSSLEATSAAMNLETSTSSTTVVEALPMDFLTPPESSISKNNEASIQSTVLNDAALALTISTTATTSSSITAETEDKNVVSPRGKLSPASTSNIASPTSPRNHSVAAILDSSPVTSRSSRAEPSAAARSGLALAASISRQATELIAVFTRGKAQPTSEPARLLRHASTLLGAGGNTAAHHLGKTGQKPSAGKEPPRVPSVDSCETQSLLSQEAQTALSAGKIRKNHHDDTCGGGDHVSSAETSLSININNATSGEDSSVAAVGNFTSVASVSTSAADDTTSQASTNNRDTEIKDSFFHDAVRAALDVNDHPVKANVSAVAEHDVDGRQSDPGLTPSPSDALEPIPDRHKLVSAAIPPSGKGDTAVGIPDLLPTDPETMETVSDDTNTDPVQRVRVHSEQENGETTPFNGFEASEVKDAVYDANHEEDVGLKPPSRTNSDSANAADPAGVIITISDSSDDDTGDVFTIVEPVLDTKTLSANDCSPALDEQSSVLTEDDVNMLLEKQRQRAASLVALAEGDSRNNKSSFVLPSPSSACTSALTSEPDDANQPSSSTEKTSFSLSTDDQGPILEMLQSSMEARVDDLPLDCLNKALEHSFTVTAAINCSDSVKDTPSSSESLRLGEISSTPTDLQSAGEPNSCQITENAGVEKVREGDGVDSLHSASLATPTLKLVNSKETENSIFKDGEDNSNSKASPSRGGDSSPYHETASSTSCSSPSSTTSSSNITTCSPSPNRSTTGKRRNMDSIIDSIKRKRQEIQDGGGSPSKDSD